MATNGIQGTGGSGQTNSTKKSDTPPDRFQELGVEQFLKLLISELQNQDPLNPTDNQQLLEQISSLKDISTSNKLTETLDSLSLEQNLASASNLLGRQISALDDKGNTVRGKVDKVSVRDGSATLIVGDKQIRLKNISEILPAA